MSAWARAARRGAVASAKLGAGPLVAAWLSGCASAVAAPVTAPHEGRASALAQAAPEPTVGAALIEAEKAVASNDAIAAAMWAQRALDNDPRNVKALYYAGLADERLSRPRDAERHYRQALAVDRSFAEAAVNLGALLIEHERAAEALEVLRPAVEASPDDPLLRENFALAAASCGDHAAAIASFVVVERAGTMRAETRASFADSLLALGRRDEAARVLKPGVAEASSDPTFVATYAHLLAAAGLYAEALPLADKVVASDPSAAHYTDRALYRRGARDLAGAKADLDRALAADANFAPVRLYLGDWYAASGQAGRARHEYEAAARLAGDDTAVGRQARERLVTARREP